MLRAESCSGFGCQRRIDCTIFEQRRTIDHSPRADSQQFRSACNVTDAAASLAGKPFANHGYKFVIVSTAHGGIQVNQLYQHFLHRTPSASEQQYWVNLLLAGADEADLPRQFIESQEYQSQHADDASFVQSLYRNVLGRAPDVEGMNYWLQVLSAGGTRDAVIHGFLNSEESTRQILDQYYVRYLKRPADAIADAFWLTPLEQWNLGATTVASLILASDEFYARPAGQ